MKKLLVVVMMLVTLVLAGCGDRISEGTVVDKSKTEAYTSIIPVLAGKRTIFIPQYHSAKYYVKVQGVDKNGKEVTEQFSVSKDSYENYQIGGSFCSSREVMRRLPEQS